MSSNKKLSFTEQNSDRKSLSNEENLPAAESKLPLKSINNRRCLTKCYPKDTTYLHPVFLTGIANIVNSCATDPVYSKDRDPKYYGLILSDTCRLEDNKIYQPPNELESILLSFYFNPHDFLVSIYGLYSFDQVIYWTLENDHLPFDTIKRVHNCAWKVFGNRIEELSASVLDYYYDIAKSHWLRDYVKVIQNKYSFDLITDKETNTDITNTEEEIYDIIISKFFTDDFFATSIKRYVYEYQDKWELIHSHYGKLKNYIFQQLIDHIENETRK